MSLNIHSKDHKQECDTGYFGFRRFRIAIANSMDKELGELYADNILLLHHPQTFEKKFEEIYQHPRMKNRKAVLNFLMMSDCYGKISPFRCKKILTEAHDVSGYEELMDVIRYCAENNQTMEWY